MTTARGGSFGEGAGKAGRRVAHVVTHDEAVSGLHNHINKGGAESTHRLVREVDAHHATNVVGLDASVQASTGVGSHYPSLGDGLGDQAGGASPNMKTMTVRDSGEFLAGRAPSRGRGTSRHGRGLRSPVSGPHLPVIHGRVETFFDIVAQTAQYLRSLWHEELADVTFEVLSAPPELPASGRAPRWAVDRAAQRIVLFRVPIQRMSRLHVDDAIHRQMAIEECVFRAVAEYLDKAPEDLGPDMRRDD